MLPATMRHRHDHRPTQTGSARRSRALRVGTASFATLLLLAGVGPASALAGPGVDFLVGSKTVKVAGPRIVGGADVQATTYTLKTPGAIGQQIQLTGLSINGLLQLAGFDPGTIQSVQVSHPDGSETDLTQAEISATPPFPEGPALVLEKGSSTVFFRPITGPGDNNASDNVASPPGVPLDITVQINAKLKVTASASPKRASVGQTVTFSAQAADLPPGAVPRYDWSFGDGTTGSGPQVTHSYAATGQYAAAVNVSVSASLGSAGDSSTLAIVVGNPKRSKVAGAGTSNSGVGGFGTGKGGGGTGNGSAKPTVRAASRTKGRTSSSPGVANPLPLQASGASAGTQVAGILLTDAGAPLAPLVAAATPSGSAASTASQATSAGAGGIGLAGGGIALTIATVVLGALDERRRTSLRTA